MAKETWHNFTVIPWRYSEKQRKKKGGEDMGNTVPVGTNQPDVKVWLDQVSKMETHIYVAIAVGSEDDALIKAEADRVRNTEMLALRHQGFEMPDGFKPEVTEQEIDSTEFQVKKYRFLETDWKRAVMGRNK